MLFDVAFNFIIAKEGGYIDDPYDKGGATKYGISSRFIKANDLKIKDVRELTLLQAKEIYSIFFWQPLKIDKINDSTVQLFLFDTAVNCGKEKAVFLLQESINSISNIAVDGRIGNETIGTCNSITSQPKQYKLLKQLLLSKRIAYYVHVVNVDESQRKFLRGWVNRALEVFKNE